MHVHLVILKIHLRVKKKKSLMSLV